MKKDLNHYRALPYTKTIRPDEDGGFEALIEELPGCFALGSNEAEAALHLNSVFDEYIEAKLAWGSDIPEPVRTVKLVRRVLLRRSADWSDEAVGVATGPKTHVVRSDPETLVTV